MATSCPETHPFPVASHEKCCSEKRSARRAGDLCGGPWLQGSDPEDCCENGNFLECADPPCKTHDTGFLYNVTHILVSEESGSGLVDYSLSPMISPSRTRNSATIGYDGSYATNYNGKLLVCGGKNCQLYDYGADQWYAFKIMPGSEIYQSKLITINGKPWRLGGAFSSLVHTDITIMYDGEAWTAGHPLPLAAKGLGAAHLDGDEIIVASGMLEDHGGGTFTYSDTVYKFNLATGEHTDLATMQTARLAATVQIVELANGQRVVIISGGFYGNSGAFKLSNEVEAFNLDTQQWDRRAAIQLPKYLIMVGPFNYLDPTTGWDRTFYVCKRESDTGSTPRNSNCVLEFHGLEADEAWGSMADHQSSKVIWATALHVIL